MQPSTSTGSSLNASTTNETEGSSSNTNGNLMDQRLLEAAIHGNTGELRELVLNADVNMLLQKTMQGSTCLHISLIFGHQGFSEAVWNLNESLLKEVNSYEETPLIVAVKGGHVSLASNLLNKYTELELSEWILRSDINGDTALHHAIRHGHEELACALIEAESSFTEKENHFNESPMYIAVMRGFRTIFDKLVDDARSSYAGAYKDNALHAAVRNGDTYIIRRIMEKCPALAKEENISGITPIHYAVNRNQTKVVNLMLEKDCSLGYLFRSQNGNPLLCCAASRGSIGVAKVILRHCPDAPYCNDTGLTMLHQSVIEDHEKFVEFALKTRQLDKLINMRDNKGYSALHYAVKSCNPKIVRTLLAHKEIDVKIYDNDGNPAFWQLLEASDSAKSLNWNEAFLLMSEADSRARSFYVRQVAKKGLQVKTMQDVKSLSAKYTKNTSLVAILIATITFAAAFALPGGYEFDGKNKGLPVMAKKPAFVIFLISDTLAMCSSIGVAFICILARWEDLKFLLYYTSVTKKLMWFSLMATNVAFATGLYTILAPRIHCTTPKN